MAQINFYELTINVEKPETAVEGERFDLIYHIRNRGNNIFPGANITIVISWANLDPSRFVTFPFSIPVLNPNDIFDQRASETPLANGYTEFTLLLNQTNEVMVPTGRVRLYLEDGRQITGGMLFGAVRAKSHEEVSQAEQCKLSADNLRIAEKTLKWAIVAFAATVLFGFIDVLLTLLLPR